MTFEEGRVKLVVRFHTEFPVVGPIEDGDDGFVLHADIVDVSSDPATVAGTARISIIPSRESIDADLDGLTNIHVRANGLLIETLELGAELRGSIVEDLVVQRLVETVGQACSFAMVRVRTPSDAEVWTRRGFVTSPDAPDGEATIACLDLRPIN